MRKRNITKTKQVDIAEVKKELSKVVIEKYGSINAFANSDEAKALGIDIMVSSVLTPNGKNSLHVLNAIADLFKLPKINKKVVVTRSVNYFTE